MRVDGDEILAYISLAGVRTGDVRDHSENIREGGSFSILAGEIWIQGLPKSGTPPPLHICTLIFL